VGDAADRAVKRSEKKKPSDRTVSEIFKDIRGNIAAHLAVTFSDTRWLLDQYDQIHAQMVQQTNLIRLATDAAILQDQEIKNMREQVDQFRTVYDQENRHTEVTVERV